MLLAVFSTQPGFTQTREFAVGFVQIYHFSLLCSGGEAQAEKEAYSVEVIDSDSQNPPKKYGRPSPASCLAILKRSAEVIGVACIQSFIANHRYIVAALPHDDHGKGVNVIAGKKNGYNNKGQR